MSLSALEAAIIQIFQFCSSTFFLFFCFFLKSRVSVSSQRDFDKKSAKSS